MQLLTFEIDFVKMSHISRKKALDHRPSIVKDIHMTIKRNLPIFLTALVSFAVLMSNGCKKSSSPTGPSGNAAITVDLFPLTVGHTITYSGYLRDAATDTNITATGAVYYTTWFVAAPSGIPTPIGGTSGVVYDTTQVPTGIVSPPTAKVITPLFIRRSAATGDSNIAFLQNIGRFYRTVGIALHDTLRWINLAQFNVGLGTEFTAFDSTWTGVPLLGTVELKIVGEFVDTENLTVGGQSFSVYKLTTVRRVYLGGSKQPDLATATFWLAAGIGPVKMIINADGESAGHYREFRSRNF